MYEYIIYVYIWDKNILHCSYDYLWKIICCHVVNFNCKRRSVDELTTPRTDRTDRKDRTDGTDRTDRQSGYVGSLHTILVLHDFLGSWKCFLEGKSSLLPKTFIDNNETKKQKTLAFSAQCQPYLVGQEYPRISPVSICCHIFFLLLCPFFHKTEHRSSIREFSRLSSLPYMSRGWTFKFMGIATDISFS